MSFLNKLHFCLQKPDVLRQDWFQAKIRPKIFLVAFNFLSVLFLLFVVSHLNSFNLLAGKGTLTNLIE